MHRTCSSRETLLDFRTIPAISVLTGDVCGECNYGWMEQLDKNIEEIVMKLSKNSGLNIEINISQKDARNIGRWLLKVACVHQYTDTIDRRHIPLSIRSSLRTDDYLPPSFVVFAIRSWMNTPGLDISILDVWSESEAETLTNFPQSTRLKFGIRYDNVIFGCCYVHSENPTFIGIDGFHYPLITSQAKFRLDKVVNTQEYFTSLPQFFGRQNTIVEVALATLGVEF